ncbi:MAG: restriction endonuclease [Bacteroidetes bacterium]|jgi:hypothetical protein|nr:restriction endonuclease [Bacteroidota bacterium]
MDFLDKMLALSSKVENNLDHIETEEATKNAFVMPFVATLGYDVFDPHEVVPEYTADFGTKKGEKVDYAILRDGQPIMLFECKPSHTDLDEVHASQLYRYFSVTDARIGVLTNGVQYRFFSDIEEANKMDSRPFLEVNMLDIHEPLIAELKKLSKSSFDLDEMIEAAGELKYTRALKQYIGQQLSDPSEDFVRFMTKQVYSGLVTQKVRDQFKPIIKRALSQFISERISERLQSAIAREEELSGGPVTAPEPTDEPDLEEGVVHMDEERGVVTTEEEMDAFRIVKAIVSQVVDPSRVAPRDVKTYFGVLLDDNNRKPICRLHFNTEQKYIGLFDDEKNEERVPIDSIEDIYRHADQLKEAALSYESD